MRRESGRGWTFRDESRRRTGKFLKLYLGEQSPRNNEGKWEMEFHKEKEVFG